MDSASNEILRIIRIIVIIAIVYSSHILIYTYNLGKKEAKRLTTSLETYSRSYMFSTENGNALIWWRYY